MIDTVVVSSQHAADIKHEQIERDIIVRALTETQFNRTQAAQLLGISFRQLRYQMQKLDIHEPES